MLYQSKRYNLAVLWTGVADILEKVQLPEKNIFGSCYWFGVLVRSFLTCRIALKMQSCFP